MAGEEPKFAFVGAGGVGGYFGARLAAAGVPVAFLARGANLEAIRQHGLAVRSELGDVRVHPATASDNATQIGPVDVAVLAVKLYDTKTALEAMVPLVGPTTAVMSLQNGVEAEGWLSDRFGVEHVIGAVSYIFSHVEAPGVIRHVGSLARVVLGEMDGAETPRCRSILAVLRRAGIAAEMSRDVTAEIWRKFAFIASLAAVAGLARVPVGPIRADGAARALLLAAIEETIAVAHARGVALPTDQAVRHMALVDSLGPDMKPSLLADLERGARIEIANLSGAVTRLGSQSGVPTPLHAIAAALLGLHAGHES